MATHTNLKSLFTDIADAIRSVEGTNDTIRAEDFPLRIEEGYENATNTIVGILQGDIKHLNSGKATNLRRQLFANCLYLEAVELPNVRELPTEVFYNCKKLTEINAPQLEFMSINCLSSTNVKRLVLKKLRWLDQSALDACASLEILDVLGYSVDGSSRIDHTALMRCNKLRALVIRSEEGVPDFIETSYDEERAVCALLNGKCHIYVPRSLMDTYKATEGWSTYASQFRALEDYTVDGTVTGALDETKI